MPCYTEWDAYLEKGSQEYEAKKVELEAKLAAVRHIVDYYYGVQQLHVPSAAYFGPATFLQMAHFQFEIDKSDLHGANEEAILKSIAHHCSCDGIHFTLMYDLVSLLNLRDNNDAGYARILMTCANEIRANKYQYEPISKRAESVNSKSERLDPKRLP